eukprot:6198858-Pleurochrysis_carterae.AAC.3
MCASITVDHDRISSLSHSRKDVSKSAYAYMASGCSEAVTQRLWRCFEQGYLPYMQTAQALLKSTLRK